MARQQSQILDSVNAVLEIVTKQACSGGCGPTEEPKDLDLPATTIEELEEVESQLQTTSCFNGLVTYLSIHGGVSRTDMTKRVLRICMTNQLALQFNWFWKKGKRPFGKLKLTHAVLKAVMKCKKATAVEVEIDYREWFRMVSDREGGRKKRMKTTVEMSVDETSEQN